MRPFAAHVYTSVGRPDMPRGLTRLPARPRVAQVRAYRHLGTDFRIRAAPSRLPLGPCTFLSAGSVGVMSLLRLLGRSWSDFQSAAFCRSARLEKRAVPATE